MAAKRLRRIPPINPNAPVLSKEDYFTIPAIKRLCRCSDDELQVRISYHTTGVLQLLGMQSVWHPSEGCRRCRQYAKRSECSALCGVLVHAQDSLSPQVS